MAAVAAVASAVFSWRAIDQADDAKEIALARAVPSVAAPGGGPPGPATPPVPTGGPAAVTTDPVSPPVDTPPPGSPPVDPNATDSPQIPADTVYTVKYPEQTLTLKARQCSSMYVDLDEPRANVAETISDLYLDQVCGASAASLVLVRGAEGSEAGAPGMTPKDCAEKIRTAPLGDATVPVRTGAVMCLATSYTAARERGDVQRMILLQVVGVQADGAVSVKLTAWNIPR